MQFIHSDLGFRERGEAVEITLTAAANVRLMSSSDFQSYRSGRRHQFVGGLARQSPIRLGIPHSGHWHICVDMENLRGQVRASFRIIPAPLPEIRQAPLSSVPSLVHEPEDNTPPMAGQTDNKTFDVFISHASEDKDDVVRPLAHALVTAGLRVWYDEFELRIGASLRRSIDKGLGSSRFGVVVLSPAFFGRGWPEYELDGLVTRSLTGDQVILPIWHKVSKREVIDRSASLADKLARSTSTSTVEEIASEIADVIRGTS